MSHIPKNVKVLKEALSINRLLRCDLQKRSINCSTSEIISVLAALHVINLHGELLET